MLTANESLPDIHKGRPLAGELSEKGYDSEKQSSKILRFNDAFLHQRPYLKQLPLESSRSEKTFATGIIKGALGSKWREPLVKLSKQTQEELEELKLANIKKSLEKYPDPDEENKTKTTEKLNKEKNEKLIDLMDDQEMRDSLYNLFPTPFELKERKEQENMSINEIEEEEGEEEYDVQRDVELMKKLLDQGDRIPFSIELTPCKIPTNEFNSAIKVIDESQDVDALKNSFLTIRKVAVFHPDLIKSSPFILSNLIARMKRYIASDANIILSLHSLKAYDEMVQHMPGVLIKYSEDFIDLFTSKYFTLEDKILCVDKEINQSEEGNLSLTESNLQSHTESIINDDKNNSRSFQSKIEKDEIIQKI